jgi:hypothetical protein
MANIAITTVDSIAAGEFVNGNYFDTASMRESIEKGLSPSVDSNSLVTGSGQVFGQNVAIQGISMIPVGKLLPVGKLSGLTPAGWGAGTAPILPLNAGGEASLIMMQGGRAVVNPFALESGLTTAMPMSAEPVIIRGLVGQAMLNPALPGLESVGGAAAAITQSIGDLRSAGLTDAHHVIQDAAVRDLAGYDTNAARGVQRQGPSTAIGTPHYEATQVQRQAGGGTYGAERSIAYNALRAAGYSDAEIIQAIKEADQYFNSIGVNENTPTRIPGNRR